MGEKINENNAIEEFSIVLEDDMDISDYELFCKVTKDILALNYDGIVMWKHPDKIPNTFDYVTENIIKYYFQWGLCAYTVNKNLCQRMLEINNISMPIDDYLYNYIFPNYNVFFTKENLFNNLGFLGGSQHYPYQFKSLIYG